MKKKIKSKVKRRTKKPANDLSKFKKLVASKFGKVNWPKIGAYGLIALILAAGAGAFCPKLQVAAVVIIKKAVFTA